MIQSRRGSLMIEHAALIVIMVAALVGMAVYLKRAICGKYRETGDVFGQGRQFEPGVTVDQNGLVVE